MRPGAAMSTGATVDLRTIVAEYCRVWVTIIIGLREMFVGGVEGKPWYWLFVSSI